MSDYVATIDALLSKASEKARSHFGKVTPRVKPEDNNQVLTEADEAIGSFIVESLQAAYPGHNIIDEEAGVIDNGSEFTWVIDPIDGTSNFASGLVTYGIMIGLLEHETPVAGGIALPAFDEIYTAEKGKGAYLDGKALSVTTETELKNVLIAFGIDGHQENPERTAREVELLGDIILHIRNLRTSNSCFDQVMVARGNYGASLNQTSKIWDNVAQSIVITEAGGLYTDFFGNPMDFSNPCQRASQNFTWCAGPAGLHAQLQHIISANN